MNESNAAQWFDGFKHPSVRDLAWAIASPPLVSGEFNQTSWWTHAECLQEFNACLPALQALDKNPHTLLEHLNRIKSKRLGIYFEALLAFWLSSISPNFRLLAQNIQLFEHLGKGKKTLGELDFIIQHRNSGKIIHLEVAVKFYLGTEPLEDTYHWFGTNTHDQLGRKLDHLKLYQTQLSKKHPELIDFKLDQRHCLLKGRLFYPASQSKKLPIPDGIAHNHLQGRWIYSSAYNKNQQLIRLEKHDWLAKLNHDDITRHLSHHTDANPNKASCFAIVEKDANSNFKEAGRVFILPDDFIFPQAHGLFL